MFSLITFWFLRIASPMETTDKEIDVIKDTVIKNLCAICHLSFNLLRFLYHVYLSFFSLVCSSLIAPSCIAHQNLADVNPNDIIEKRIPAATLIVATVYHDLDNPLKNTKSIKPDTKDNAIQVIRIPLIKTFVVFIIGLIFSPFLGQVIEKGIEIFFGTFPVLLFLDIYLLFLFKYTQFKLTAIACKLISKKDLVFLL